MATALSDLSTADIVPYALFWTREVSGVGNAAGAGEAAGEDWAATRDGAARKRSSRTADPKGARAREQVMGLL